MRASRPVAAAQSADANPYVPGADAPDSGQSAMDVLTKAAYISAPRVAPRSRPAAAAGTAAAVGRNDLSRSTSAPPLHRPTVTGAAGGVDHAGDHVGGAMLPPPANTVALSDGTRISFRAVAEIAEVEYV